MIGALAKLAKRRKIQKAREGYASAKQAYDDAVSRRDTRDQARASALLTAAATALLQAETVRVRR